AFEGTRHFCVNTLMPGQENIADVFGGRVRSDDKFAHGDWIEGRTGVPVFADASVSFECELVDAVDQATHRVLFGRVIDIRENEVQATLLYCMRRYISG
ncbi:MAG: FMN reductase, partial [Hyphomicrobiales bacterium]